MACEELLDVAVLLELLELELVELETVELVVEELENVLPGARCEKLEIWRSPKTGG